MVIRGYGMHAYADPSSRARTLSTSSPPATLTAGQQFREPTWATSDGLGFSAVPLLGGWQIVLRSWSLPMMFVLGGRCFGMGCGVALLYYSEQATCSIQNSRNARTRK
ncbi:hypothetical protein IWX90DRAFT_422453 [Phyllosticta citrichinensis]|uniref:Uncharacterized protein n=1 Tax=Phyllosticta citrichinensis TaxID=1130410 RepID=A0ABR1Y8F1_9PEZI